jgi:two-component sensor histidine kinase
VTLGLITTELVTNALKHAFPGNRSGDVTVTFACADGQCVLVVADNGIGLASVDEKASSHSGLRLVSSMVLQLGATVTEDMQDGTRLPSSARGAMPAKEIPAQGRRSARWRKLPTAVEHAPGG